MGTDWVRLFDKRLCDRILALDGAGLAEFVESRLQEFGEFGIFRLGLGSGIDLIAELVRQGLSTDALKRELIQELCFVGERLPVDYWGCFVEVFRAANPPGAISELALFPHQVEEHFLLLQPEHVERMLVSLRAHWGEVEVMSNSDLERLESWREQFVQDEGRMVAYFFDF